MANAVITNKGLALLAKLTQGNDLEITSAKTGAGTVDASLLQEQTGVTTPKQTMAIQNVSYPEDGKCALVLSVTNDGVASSYTMMQIGLYANDPDEGEVLFSIFQADSGAGINIPSENVLPGYNAELNYYIQYDQADSVNVNVDPANTVSRATMEAYVADKVTAVVDAHTGNTANPHNVTAAQVGLDKVNNTADSEKNVAFASEAAMARKVQYNLVIRLNGGSTEGTDMWTFNGSTSRSINITPAKIGAAAADHTHPVSDITGAVSLEDLPNLYIWGKYEGAYGLSGSHNIKVAQLDGSTYSDIAYASHVEISEDKITLAEPSVLSGIGNTTASHSEAAKTLAGKFVEDINGVVYFCAESLTSSYVMNTKVDEITYLMITTVKLVTAPERIGFVASKNKSTYPTDGEHTDGYWYMYHKQLGE